MMSHDGNSSTLNPAHRPDGTVVRGRVWIVVVMLLLTGCQSVNRQSLPVVADPQRPRMISTRLSQITGCRRLEPSKSQPGPVGKLQPGDPGRQDVSPAAFHPPIRMASKAAVTDPQPDSRTACDSPKKNRKLYRLRRHMETDLEDFLARLKDDAAGAANWHNAAILGIALGGALGIRHQLDDDVRSNTRRHPERWGNASRTLGRAGEPQNQIAALALLYAYCRASDDQRFDGVTGSLFSAFTLNGLATLAIKAIANTDRPSSDWNGGQFGFPSYHASSTFAIAAVLDDYYGPRAGIPAYALAGLVGFSRIDERDHDLSDVVFGAALGYVIGKSVAGRQLRGDGRVRFLPYAHPDGGSGLMLEVKY